MTRLHDQTSQKPRRVFETNGLRDIPVLYGLAAAHVNSLQFCSGLHPGLSPSRLDLNALRDFELFPFDRFQISQVLLGTCCSYFPFCYMIKPRPNTSLGQIRVENQKGNWFLPGALPRSGGADRLFSARQPKARAPRRVLRAKPDPVAIWR